MAFLSLSPDVQLVSLRIVHSRMGRCRAAGWGCGRAGSARRTCGTAISVLKILVLRIWGSRFRSRDSEIAYDILRDRQLVYLKEENGRSPKGGRKKTRKTNRSITATRQGNITHRSFLCRKVGAALREPRISAAGGYAAWWCPGSEETRQKGVCVYIYIYTYVYIYIYI